MALGTALEEVAGVVRNVDPAKVEAMLLIWFTIYFASFVFPAADAAPTFAALQEAGRAYGERMGPSMVRIVTTLVTLGLSSATGMPVPVTRLPGGAQAVANAEAMGFRLTAVASGSVAVSAAGAITMVMANEATVTEPGGSANVSAREPQAKPLASEGRQRITLPEKRAGHIFRPEDGHLADTPRTGSYSSIWPRTLQRGSERIASETYGLLVPMRMGARSGSKRGMVRSSTGSTRGLIVNSSDKISVRQAYVAMYQYLKRIYELTGSDELGGLLGSMSLLPDGQPADPAAWSDWLRAVGDATEGTPDLQLGLKD